MNTIKKFIKFNWNKKTIVGSFILNSGMLYYNNCIKGRITYEIPPEICYRNSHIFPIRGSSTSNFPIEILFMPYYSMILGAVSVPFSIYDTYNNLQQHNEDYTIGCLCGKF